MVQNVAVVLALAEFLLAFGRAAAGVEIQAAQVVGAVVTNSAVAWPGNVDFLAWSDTQTVVYAGRSGFVKCTRLGQETALWAVQITAEIDDLTSGAGKVFVLSRDSAIHVLDGLDGSEQQARFRAGGPTTADANPLTPYHVAWLPSINRLIVASYKTGASNLPKWSLWALDGWPMRPIEHLAAGDGFILRLLVADGGRHGVLQFPEGIQTWELDAEPRETLRLTPLPGAGRVIDAPFVSGAAFDGKRTLIWTTDEGWGTGTVHVYDTDRRAEITCFGSRNWHVVMDVDFQKSRILLSGTSENVCMLDFSGRVLAEKVKAADGRIVSMKLCPRGDRVAIGSCDNTVRILTICED